MLVYCFDSGQVAKVMLTAEVNVVNLKDHVGRAVATILTGEPITLEDFESLALAY